MKDRSDWDYILTYTDALFYRLADGIARRVNMSLVDSHEQAWVLFEQGQFKLKPGAGESVVEVVPCYGDNDQRAAMEQNKPLACYRRQVIDGLGRRGSTSWSGRRSLNA